VTWAAIGVAIVVVAACVGWAVLVQGLVTPACDLAHPPSNAGYLDCPAVK
jgi:hypothetical protein